MTQTTLPNAQLMQSLYAAFAQGHMPTIVGAMDENIEWHEAEGNPWHPGHALVGPEQVVAGVFARIAQEFEDFRIDIHRVIDGGDTVIVEARYAATRHTTTGKPLDAQVAHVWDLRDGKAVRFQQYVDTRRMADVTGDSAY